MYIDAPSADGFATQPDSQVATRIVRGLSRWPAAAVVAMHGRDGGGVGAGTAGACSRCRHGGRTCTLALRGHCATTAAAAALLLLLLLAATAALLGDFRRRAAAAAAVAATSDPHTNTTTGAAASGTNASGNSSRSDGPFGGTHSRGAIATSFRPPSGNRHGHVHRQRDGPSDAAPADTADIIQRGQRVANHKGGHGGHLHRSRGRHSPRAVKSLVSDASSSATECGGQVKVVGRRRHHVVHCRQAGRKPRQGGGRAGSGARPRLGKPRRRRRRCSGPGRAPAQAINVGATVPATAAANAASGPSDRGHRQRGHEWKQRHAGAPH